MIFGNAMYLSEQAQGDTGLPAEISSECRSAAAAHIMDLLPLLHEAYTDWFVSNEMPREMLDELHRRVNRVIDLGFALGANSLVEEVELWLDVEAPTYS